MNAGYEPSPSSGLEREGNSAPHQQDICSPVVTASSPEGRELGMASSGAQFANHGGASTNINRCEPENFLAAYDSSQLPTVMEGGVTASPGQGFINPSLLLIDLAGDPDARLASAGLSSPTGLTEGARNDPLGIEAEGGLHHGISTRPPELTVNELQPSSSTDGNSEPGVTGQSSHNDCSNGEEDEDECTNGEEDEDEEVCVQGEAPPANSTSQSQAERHKRPAEADSNVQMSRKRRDVQRSQKRREVQKSHKRREVTNNGPDVSTDDSYSPPESPSSEEEQSEVSPPDDGFIVMCEVTNYRAVQEKAFEGKNRKVQDRRKVKDLFRFYTKLTTMVRALILLGTICTTDPWSVDIGCLSRAQAHVWGDKLRPEASTVARQACIWANNVITTCPQIVGLVCIRQIMGMITLHMIYENYIVPMWEKNPPNKLSNGHTVTELEFYYNIFGGEKAFAIPLRIFQDRVRDGRALFTLAQSIGAPALLMIAAGGRGASATARELPKYSHVIPGLTATLSTSPEWWCFTHAIGHLTVARLFGTMWQEVNAAHLAYWMRSQPLPIDIARKWDITCEEENIRQDPTPRQDSLRLVPEDNYPTVAISWLGYQVQISPMIGRVDTEPANEVEEVSEWLRDLDAEQVEIGTGQIFKLDVLRDLFPGNVITSRLMDFFCALDNARSLDGRLVLDSALGSVLLGQPTPHTGLEKLREAVGDEVWGKKCHDILAAITGANGILGLHLIVEKECAFLYNWMDNDAGTGLLEHGQNVGCTSHYPLQDSVILTIQQVAGRCLPAGWRIQSAQIDPSEFIDTKRESALSFLHFSRLWSTGSGYELRIPGLLRPPTIREITRGLMVDGFELGMEGGWRVHPSYWFGLSKWNI